MKKKLITLNLCLVCLMLVSLQAYGLDLRFVEIKEINGTVQVKTTDGDWAPAKAGMKLNQSDEIRTGKDSAAILLMDEKGKTARLEMRENSYLILSTMARNAATEDKETLLDLAIGKVLVHAGKLTGDSKFEVRTPTATTGIRGTVFEVSVDKES